MSSLVPQLVLFATAVVCVRWLWTLFSLRRTLDNIPGPPSPSFWTGNFGQIYSVDGWAFHQQLAEKYGGVVRVDGLLGEKQLYVFDPKALQHVFLKDQDSFEAPIEFTRMQSVIFGEALVSSTGGQHRKQRRMFNPVFSAAHLRNMVPIFFGVGKKLRAVIEAKVKDGPKEVDILARRTYFRGLKLTSVQVWMSRTALELVGQAGLGYSFDALVDDAVPAYITSAQNMQITIFKMALPSRYVLPWAVKIGGPKFRRAIVNITPWKDLHTARDIIDDLHRSAVNIYTAKKKALEAGDEAVAAQIAQGKDIISILMKENSNASTKDRLSETEILGQLNLLVFASTDTTSAALARTLHLLAHNPDVQMKLRQEVNEIQIDQEHYDLTYDELTSKLPYLDAVCRESLRLHPPISFVSRTAQKTVVLPLSAPIVTVSGSTVSEVVVPAGINVLVSILASNRNEAVWGPDCLEFKPERWLSTLPQSVTDTPIPGVYSNLMTFLGGPRSCIGFKFSQLEMKVILSLLVGRFKFSPSDKDSEISWKMSSIAVPNVGSDPAPQLPMKVELA
ncbi:cytochrome P450 [Mycena haematopus]|nr:cytochrome P450 [Mycena haematopus]